MQTLDFFKLLADETRLRILHLLGVRGELCVCELTAALNLSQPKISRHLAALRSGGLVLDTRRATWAFYRLHPDLPAWAHHVLNETFSHLSGVPPFRDDLLRVSLLSVPADMRCPT